MKQIPKINFETKPRITFNLNPILISFCRYIFNSDPYHKYIILSRRHDIGKLIFSHIQSGDVKVERPFIEHPVTFVLPIPNIEHAYWLKYRHIYVPNWVEEKYSDAIEYEFKWWVREKFRVGYEEEGWDQKTIVNAILRGLNVRNSVANFDTIKKIDYRNRRKLEHIRFKKLCNAELASI